MSKMKKITQLDNTDRVILMAKSHPAVHAILEDVQSGGTDYTSGLESAALALSAQLRTANRELSQLRKQNTFLLREKRKTR
jgi:hypothetical protein